MDPDMSAKTTEKATPSLLRKQVRPYAVADDRAAFLGLFASGGVLIALFVAANLSTGNPVLFVALSLLLGLAAIKLFIIQHDCGHRSFFKSRLANDVTGNIISLVTLAPHASWRFLHNFHHAHNGNIDHRGVNDVYMKTVAEYEQSSRLQKLIYRLYRNPIILFLIAPFLLFVFYYRLPGNVVANGTTSVMLHTGAILVFSTVLVLIFGWSALLVQGIMIWVASSIGVFTFYLQHNFEHTYFEHHEDWDFETAALEGSSVIQFGWVFDIITGNIAYHNLHHLNPRIPSYRLKTCFYDLKASMQPRFVGIRDALLCTRMKLWDENSRQMVAFP
jgi:omega-6 fatty acid desaturase (delta-12 desaturase)